MAEQGAFSNRVLGGKYLLGDLLGEGGFGAVYQALNRSLNRPQAIKVLLEKHLRDPKFHERFIREAQTLAALDHPNIVHVDELGEEPDVVYLVMPYISGGTFQDILKARTGPLGLDEVLRALEQICSALGYAHAQGVVHLDLKPLNLLVHQDGRLLLSDFGLAHLMEQGAVDGGTSLQFGSPLYMAPEHFEGKPTQRSDLYALGIMLYQMLTGHPPFVASSPVAVMRKHLTEPPPPLHAARSDLPLVLDAVIEKALAKQAEQRYGRAGELLFDFRSALGGQALQFASSAEPTHLAQAYLAPTLQAVNQPLSPVGPTLPDAGRTAPALTSNQLGIAQRPPPQFSSPGTPTMVSLPWSTSPSPGMRTIWSPGFAWFFGGIVLAALGLTLVVNLLISGIDYTNVDMSHIITIDWIVVVLMGVMLSVCLVGWYLVRSGPARVGFLLQACSLACTGIRFLLILLPLIQGFDFIGGNFYSEPLQEVMVLYLPFLLTVLNAAGLATLSYGLAWWKPVTRFGALHLLVSVVAAYLFTGALFPGYLYFSVVGVLIFLAVASTFFAVSVFFLRPACWKQHPIVTVLLGVGAALFVLQGPDGGEFLVRVPIVLATPIAFYRFVDNTYLISWLLSLLGFLLLIQTVRVRVREQPLTGAPVLLKRLP